MSKTTVRGWFIEWRPTTPVNGRWMPETFQTKAGRRQLGEFGTLFTVKRFAADKLKSSREGYGEFHEYRLRRATITLDIED